MNYIEQMSSSQVNKTFIFSKIQEESYSRFKADPDWYAASLSRMGRGVFMYLFQFRNMDGVILSNGKIADRVGCSRRTVARFTRRFHDDGIILKYHHDTYAMNRYFFHPSLIEGRAAFSLWFKTLSEEQQEIYWKCGKQGLVDDSVTPLLVEDTMGEVFEKAWDGLPENVKYGVSQSSVYGISKEKNLLNGKDDKFIFFRWPYGEKSGEKNAVFEEGPEDGPRKDAPKICWDCFEDIKDCPVRGGHDKKDEYHDEH